jgi:hypothetical protein
LPFAALSSVLSEWLLFMLVYGDQSRTENPRDVIKRLEEALRRLGRMPTGIERHAAVVAALIDTGELAQGLADAQFAALGHDARSDLTDAVMTLMMGIASCVRRSWRSGFTRQGVLPEAAILNLTALPLPDAITTKTAEGFSLYSLYPETYLEAAGMMDAERRPTQVIGLRSVGAPLAAIVAAGLGVRSAVTLRPTGHPFHREVKLAEALAADILADRQASFAIVDEGPGMSGSSFGAVADFLETGGVSPDRIHFFPSHWGMPGGCSSERHRQRWQQASRHVVDIGDMLIHKPRRPEHRLETWAANLVGPPTSDLTEISAGGWRKIRYASEAEWPAVKVQLERRKFLLPTASATWLLKFVGLGSMGARKLSRALSLHAAGFTPEVAGFRHGFLVERWIDGAVSLDQWFGDRDRVVDQVGRYLGFRARHFEAGPEQGASLKALAEMARFNTSQILGEEAARDLDRLLNDATRLESAVRRVETDNRLHAWEWLHTPDGRLLKTDALDHHAGHDLIGCQDITWDIAGATVELNLSDSERNRLCRIVAEQSGHPVNRDLLALLTPCYPAFQMADHALAANAAAPESGEANRLRAATGRHARRLVEIIATGCSLHLLMPVAS